MAPETFYSNGKLLLTGEYVVLDGALSLALPTKLGQSLTIEEIDQAKLIWKSYDETGAIWYEDVFLLAGFKSERQNHPHEISQRVIQILNAAKELNPEFLSKGKGFNISTKLDFPRNWGLGTSSTLINNIASWANVNAYTLLEMTFGGSGYDIACAQSDSAISYQLLREKPHVKSVEFNPPYKQNLYFVYLNKKQNSREGIAHYKLKNGDISYEMLAINEITLNMIGCKNLYEFQELMDAHEGIISGVLKMNTIKDLLFKDFEGSIKSLGAWGGDFVLVASQENPSGYFKTKGFDTVIGYSDLIK